MDEWTEIRKTNCFPDQYMIYTLYYTCIQRTLVTRYYVHNTEK